MRYEEENYMDIHSIVDLKGREVALRLAYVMAKVEYDYNRHEPCLVCKEKYMHHIDGLPCESDDKIKEKAPYGEPVDAKWYKRKVEKVKPPL